MLLRVINILFLVAYVNSAKCTDCDQIEEVAAWKKFEFTFPSAEDEHYALAHGYNETTQKRAYSFGFINKQTLLTLPRISTGVPYTLAVVTNELTESGYKLAPFPDYEIHKADPSTPCSQKIISVFRLRPDDCGNLWTIDYGYDEFGPVCPPKIIKINKCGRLEVRYTFPAEGAPYGPMTGMFIKSEDKKCKKSKFYITMPRTYELAVYDDLKKSSWIISHDTFEPDHRYVLGYVNRIPFRFDDGLYSLVANDTHLIYHPYASISEYAVPLKIINNEKVWKANPYSYPNEFKLLGSRSVQWSATTICPSGIVYGVYTTPGAVYGWDPKTPYNENNMKKIASDNDLIQFASYAHCEPGAISMFINRYQLSPNYPENEYNFRILKVHFNCQNHFL